MKVEFKPTIANPQKTFFTKLRRFLSGKIKPAIKDSFEKTTSKSENTARKVIISRENPNWCDGPEYRYRNNTIARTRCYYPEDLKKMETMSKKEVYAFKDHLDRIGRFYYDDNYHVDTPELDEYFKEHGIDISKFIIKDKE